MRVVVTAARIQNNEICQTLIIEQKNPEKGVVLSYKRGRRPISHNSFSAGKLPLFGISQYKKAKIYITLGSQSL